MTEDPNAWNRKIIAEFRENNGKVGGMFENMPMLLLNTTGAKSGEPRTNPLAYYAENGHMYIFASFAGSPNNPAWFHNLVAHPEVTVELGSEKFPATAVVVEGAKRDQIYADCAKLMPNFGEYEQKTSRKIPVVELVRK